VLGDDEFMVSVDEAVAAVDLALAIMKSLDEERVVEL